MIDINAAIEGVDLYSEHAENAQDNPGRHPNIDILMNVIENEEVLSVKIIK